jgi:transposase
VPLVLAAPGKPGRPKPASLLADKGYDSGPLRGILRWLGIRPRIPRRGEDDRGLGRFRWVVERSLSWFHQFRRLRIRWVRRAEVHQAFLDLAAAVIGYRLWKGES